MLLRGGCRDCYKFHLEPLLQNLRFVMAPAGEAIYYPRSHKFDPSWFTPAFTDAFLQEWAQNSTVLEPFVNIMCTLGRRAATAIKKELHGMLKDRPLVKLLGEAAKQMRDAQKEAERLAAQQARAGRTPGGMLAAAAASVSAMVWDWEATDGSPPEPGNSFNIGDVGPSYPVLPYCPACGDDCNIHQVTACPRPRPRRRWFWRR